MLHAIAAAALALSDPAGPVVEARVADVIADPERYGGQTLRLRGQIDACYSWVCSICPEEMTPGTADPEKCLRISSDGFGAEEDWADDEGPPFDRDVWPDMEKAFRFSVVTAEGHFNPSCLTHRPWPPEPPPAPSSDQDATQISEVVCMDRATTWSGVQVRSVHRRLPSNGGLLFDLRHDGPVKGPPTIVGAAAEAPIGTTS